MTVEGPSEVPGADLLATDRLLLCGNAEHWRTDGLIRAAKALGIRYWTVEPYSPRRALDLINEHRITVSDWYPWQLIELLELPADVRSAYRGQDHRLAWVGGARIPVALNARMADWWGPILSTHLGLPESEFDVVGINGALCGPEQIGVLTVREADPELFEKDNQLLGYCDDNGQIYSLGPSASAMSSAYGWLSGYECEQLLEDHPAVAAAACVAITSERACELGYELSAEAGFFAVVVLRADAQPGTPLLELALLELCLRKLSALKCPFGLVFGESLPRASGGDIDHAALLALIESAH